MSLDTFLTDLQADIVGRLKADEELGQYVILSERHGDIDADINQALGLVSSATGKVGLCLIVMQMVGSAESSDYPVPVLRPMIVTRILENPALNTSGPRALDLALRVALVLHHYQPHALVSALTPETPLIVPAADPAGSVAYEVQLSCYQERANLGGKVPTPAVSAASGPIVTITCADGAAAIWYTLDGSHPWSGNANATHYTTPFSAPASFSLRACAFRAGYIASNVASLVVG